MAKVDREVLLDKGSLSDASRVFEIPVGGELTFVAMGLNDEDYVHFELVYAPGMDSEMCKCPPPVVTPPVVTSKAVLQYNGVPVILKKNNPVAVISAPQGQPMRAVRHIKDEDDIVGFRLTMQSTETRMLNDHVMGLIPWTVDETASAINAINEGEEYD